mgnify:CR=1 FL=1
MPRARFNPPERVEHLSILDEYGHVDAALDPRLPASELMRLYRHLILARRWDERMVLLNRQGRIGNYPPFRGQEAASIGPAYVLDPRDWLIPSFRELSALVWHGWPMEKLILGWWGGHEYGASPPEGVNALPLCGPVAGQCLHAAGLAWGCKLRGDGSVVVCFVGDGGTSEGDFYESLNIAGVFRLPLIMVVQNNQWAISMPRSRQTASATLAQKALAFGFDGLQTDGNDILSMVVATREAVDAARAGTGPTLIEALTYRMGPHSTSDDPRKYRDEAEVKMWQRRDPILRFEMYLSDRGLLNDDVKSRVTAEADERIAEAIARADAYQANPLEPFDHCFATRSADLERQRAELEAFLAATGRLPAAPPPPPAPSTPRQVDLSVIHARTFPPRPKQVPVAASR